MSDQYDFIKGRGAQINPKNQFLNQEYVREFAEGIDDWERHTPKTTYLNETADNIAHQVEAPDVPMEWSVNPYQGCEHGCIYCYARPTHEYWGYSAGTDFESKILVKHNAADKLKELFESTTWQPAPISLSGNTDCYQPAERKNKITRAILKVCLEYKNPVGISTKNALILRDLDIIQELHKYNLVQVFTSITSTNEKLRLQLEPRTSTYSDRFKVLEILSSNNIPTGIMNAPIIPGLNDTDMHDVLKRSSEAGAKWAGYTLVRLNGPVVDIFQDWLRKTYPDKADKIINLIKECNDGGMGNLNIGSNLSGTGNVAQIINQQFKLYLKKFNFADGKLQLSTKHFIRKGDIQGSLF
jgi:DNA repair photolyase